MKNKAQGNAFAEIEWRGISKALKYELKNKHLAIGHWGKGCLISTPKTAKNITDVHPLLKNPDVVYLAHENFDWLNENPEKLIKKIRLQREAMSRAEHYDGDLIKKMNASEFHLAGALYAFHARCCIIADLDSRDRRAEALIALENLNEYPALLVCREMHRKYWVDEIQRRIKDVEIYDFKENKVSLPEGKGKHIFLLTYANLKEKAPILQRKKPRSKLKKHPYFTIIVDRADYLQNTQSPTFKMLHKLSNNKMQRCRLVLTDRPMSSSKKDLEVSLKLLGLWDGLDKKLQRLIEKSPRDPADEQRSNLL